MNRLNPPRTVRLEYLKVSLALILLTIVLWPTLKMPYLGDDTFNAYLDGWRGFNHYTVAEAYHQLFILTNIDVGRFYPIYPLLLLIDFHVNHNLILLKAAVITLILVNSLTFYALIRLAARPFALPMLASLAAVLQIRFFHDPIVQFSLHMQIAWEFSILAALCIVLARRQRYVWILGVVCYSVAALTYEATYAFVPIFLALIYCFLRDSKKVLVATSAAYLAVPVACSLVALIIRVHTIVPANSPYAIHPDLPSVFHTAAIQALGAVPLTFAFFNPAEFMPSLPQLIISKSSLIIAILSAIIAFTILKSGDRKKHSQLSLITVAFSVTLILASASLISLSVRWQTELKPGLAYTPVYFEYYGAALICGVIVRSLSSVRSFSGSMIAAIFIGFITGTTYEANITAMNHFYKWTMIVPDSIDAGVLGAVHDGDNIYLDDSYPSETQLSDDRWDVRNFLFYHTGHRLIGKRLQALSSSNDGSTALVADIRNFNDGTVVAGHVVNVYKNDTESVPFVDRNARYTVDGIMQTLSRGEMRCGPAPLENVLSAIASSLLVRYGPAFYETEYDGSIPFRWASRSEDISLINLTQLTHKTRAAFTVRAASYPANLRINVLSQTFAEKLKADAAESFEIMVGPNMKATIQIKVDGSVAPNNPGGRSLQYQVRNFSVTDDKCKA